MSRRRRSWFRLIAPSIFLPVRQRSLSLSDAGKPEFIAADLVAQAEHDPETLAIFITTSLALGNAVAEHAAKLAALQFALLRNR